MLLSVMMVCYILQPMENGWWTRFRVYRLGKPYDLNTMQNDCSQDRFDLGTLARGDGSGPLANGSLNSEYGRLYDMEFSPDGRKIFLVNGLTSATTSGLLQFSLSKAFDLKTAKFDTHQNFTRKLGSVAFNPAFLSSVFCCDIFIFKY